MARDPVGRPLIGLLAPMIKRFDSGPAFNAQTQVGRMGKPIRVLKLRSMYVDTEQRLRARWPSPFPAYHTDGFNRACQTLRSSVPPGLTGLWQVSSRSDGDLETQKNQDSFYIRNWLIWLDLYILLATVPAVISGSGAR